MINRSNNLTYFTVCIGCLLLSIGYNIYLSERIRDLENTIHCNRWVSPFDYEQIKNELLRLDKVKYE